MKLKRFLEDSKWQPQFIIVEKTLDNQPSKTSKMEPFAN